MQLKHSALPKSCSLLHHMANHKGRFWDRWPMVITLTQSRVKPRKTTRRLFWFSPIRALRVRRTCEEGNERRYRLDKAKRSLTEVSRAGCLCPCTTLQHMSYSQCMHGLIMDQCVFAIRNII